MLQTITVGLFESDYKDGKRITIFKNLKDVKAKALKTVIKDRLKLIGK